MCYKRFIKDFSKITKHLCAILELNRSFVFNEDWQQAYLKVEGSNCVRANHSRAKLVFAFWVYVRCKLLFNRGCPYTIKRSGFSFHLLCELNFDRCLIEPHYNWEWALNGCFCLIKSKLILWAPMSQYTWIIQVSSTSSQRRMLNQRSLVGFYYFKNFIS